MLTPDTIVKERYRIIRYLAEGGCGFVYEAEDLTHKRTVALKQLRYVEPIYLRAFNHEAKRLADLHHPSFPEVYDPFEWRGNAFLAMEFIVGDNLRAALSKRGAPFPPEQVLRWAFILLDALDYLHTRDPIYPIIHRDIKPDNLKINEANRIRRSEIILLDFGLSKGIARGISQASAGESIVGYTRFYASPEQELAHLNSAQLVSAYPLRARRFKERPTDARSDLYSLAATLYTLLTGGLPPAASERAAHLWENRGDLLQSIHEINPGVPAFISAIIMRAMSFEPEERFASAAEMRDALEAAGFGGTQTPSALPPLETPLHAPTIFERTTVAMLRVEYGTLGFCDAAVRSVVFSPQGDHLASGSNDGAVRLWDVATGEASVLGYCEPGRTGLGYISAVSFAPDGNSIASVSSDGAIRLWRADATEAPSGRILSVCENTPRSVAFSPCGEHLVTGSSDGAVHLWDIASGSSTPLGQCEGAVWSVAFSPDGASVVAESDDETLRIWHLETRRLSTLRSFDADVRAIALSPDGKLVAAGGWSRRIFLAEVGAHLMHELAASDNVVRALAFSPDSSKLAIGGEDRLVRLCDVRTGAVRTLGECDDVVSSVAFSSDTRTVASGSWDKSIRLWDVLGSM
jgi:serine/threonine protein kinase